MKVWVVESGAYEQRGIRAIYSSLEKAMADNPPGPKGKWEQVEEGWWTNGLDFHRAVDITEYEVL